MLIAWHAINFAILGYEAFGAYSRVARKAEKTILVKLLTLVLHLLHARLEYLRALVTARRKRLIVALAAVQRVVFRAEWLVDERQLAHMTKKALLMPMLVLVREVLGVGADFLLALLTIVSEKLLVAFDAVRMLVFEYVARARQRRVTVPTAKVVCVKVLIHPFRVFAVEY